MKYFTRCSSEILEFLYPHSFSIPYTPKSLKPTRAPCFFLVWVSSSISRCNIPDTSLMEPPRLHMRRITCIQSSSGTYTIAGRNFLRGMFFPISSAFSCSSVGTTTHLGPVTVTISLSFSLVEFQKYFPLNTLSQQKSKCYTIPNEYTRTKTHPP